MRLFKQSCSSPQPSSESESYKKLRKERWHFQIIWERRNPWQWHSLLSNLTVLSFVSYQNLSPNFILRNCSPMMLANNSPTSPSFTANSEIPENIVFVITICFLATKYWPNKILRTQENWWAQYSTYVTYSQRWHNFDILISIKKMGMLTLEFSFLCRPIGNYQWCLCNTHSIKIGCSIFSQEYCKLIGWYWKIMSRLLWT